MSTDLSLADLTGDITARIDAAPSLAALDEIRVAALGKKGQLTERLKGLGKLSPDERKTEGAAINAAKEQLNTALESKKAVLEAAALAARLEGERVDVSLPARPESRGHLHPISQTIEEVIAIFGEMGFAVADGPDIENGWRNFSALNMPTHHPARQMMDTFYLPPIPGEADPDQAEMVLRTHTSPVQVRTMVSQPPPIRIIAPGRTYRSDYDMTHTPMFHQVEGLLIDEATTMAHLKGCLVSFVRRFFGIDDLPVRFRPSFFPFTEPSAEVDIGCSRKGGELKIGAGDDWLEILGSGMAHPAVLRNCGIDPERYQGFAFGMGIERIAMLKYGIPDLRTFFESDARWLKHYGFAPNLVPSTAHGLS